jgi:hypothetical protein
MRKWIWVATVLALISSGLFFACSDKKESASEKGAIRQMTDAAAKKMVDKMQSPIDKARQAGEKQEGRDEDMEKALKE